MDLKFHKQVLYLVLIINIIVSCASNEEEWILFFNYFPCVLHVQNAILGVDFSLHSGIKFLLALMGLTRAHW